MSEVSSSKDMAEKGVTTQQPADLKEEQTPPMNSDHASNEHKPADLAPNVKQQIADEVSDSSSSSLTNEVKNDDAENVVRLVENGDSAEEKRLPSVEDDREGNSSLPEPDEDSHGDYIRNEPEAISDEKKKPGTLTLSGDGKDEQVDGPTTTNEEASAANNVRQHVENISAEEDVKEEVQDLQENSASPETPLLQKMSMKKESADLGKDVQNIGHTAEDVTEPSVPGGSRRLLAAVSIVVIVAILVQHLLQPESPPQKKDVRQIDIFLKQMEKVKTGFPHQRAELWTRSRIHLQRHLQTVQPTEPVSLILTAGLRAERTLHCLAQALASAFSSAHNASVLHIDGASKASEDSDQVKLDIDSKLQGAFEGDKPVAVIHRFEELPPGSTLIFYRYCDHENAAYKKTFLIFTVLLGEEDEIPAEIRLSAVEEMVDDHLQKKFLSHGRPVSFDKMDLDKYGGLWSRISHLILPVAAEDRIEQDGCQRT